MTEWWQNLSSVNRGFFCAAAFFSVFFIWQLLAALIGLGDDDGGHDAGDSCDVEGEDFDVDAHSDAPATVMAFKLLSIRAIITFCTLFTWGSALYLSRDVPLGKAMGISTIWGLAGMASVAIVLALLPKLAHTGTKRLSTALGMRGSVYLDIPEGGMGEIRIPVSGVISYVKAISTGGKALKVGTPVIVKRVLDETSVEVEEESKTA